MTELAKGLLAYLEKTEAELKADPDGFKEKLKRGRAEALDLIIENLNKIGDALSMIEEPESKEAVEEMGGYEKVKAQLEERRAFYSDLYKTYSDPLPELDLEALKAEAEQEAAAAEEEGYITLTGDEYNDLIQGSLDGDTAATERLQALNFVYSEDIELEREKRQTNKELLNVLAEGKGSEAEALLLTATLEDYAAAGITLSTRQRDAILNGATEPIKGIIYGLLFTELLKLWRVMTTKSAPQAEGLQFTPYSLNKPQTTAIAVSKVALHLAEIEASGEKGRKVSVGGKDVVEIRALMKYDDENITLLGRPLTDFDKTVHDAAAAIYAAGNSAFTVQDLYRACNGLDIDTIKAETLTPYIESIEQSITRRLRIDATNQINAYYKGKVKKVVYENYFLPLKAVEITMSNGEKVKGYAFLDAPPLYEYSSNIKQIVAAPIGLLRASKNVRNTPETATITNYLIRRIDGIKNPKNKLQPKIAYDAIFTAAGIDTSKLDRTQLKRKRDIVKAKLDYFKLQGFIKDYTEYKNGRQAGGVEIIY